MTDIIGVIAMVGGFLSMLGQNYVGAYCCFGYAFILWVIVAISHKRTTKEVLKNDR